MRRPSKRCKKKHQQQELRRQQQAAGLSVPSEPAPARRLCPYQSIEQERAARTEAVIEHAGLISAMLPWLLRRLGAINAPRQPQKIKHALTCLMLYGILVFVLQFCSRREANAEISRPMFEHNLRLLFPELQTLPHADTLFRLLCKIDVTQIEQAHLDLIKFFEKVFD